MGVGIVLVVMWEYYSGIFVIWCATTYYNTGWLLLQLSSWLFYFSNFFFKWTAKLRLIFDNLIINFSFFIFFLPHADLAEGGVISSLSRPKLAKAFAIGE